MRKHTNFNHEITGEYYKPTRFFDGFDWRITLTVVVMIVACIGIYLVASLMSV